MVPTTGFCEKLLMRGRARPEGLEARSIVSRSVMSCSSSELQSRADSLVCLRAHKSIAALSSTLQVVLRPRMEHRSSSGMRSIVIIFQRLRTCLAHVRSPSQYDLASLGPMRHA